MLLSTQCDDNSYLRRLLSFDDDVDGVLDVGEEHPRFFAQVTCTLISVRLAPRQDRHSGVKRRTAVADGTNEDGDEDGGDLTQTVLSSTKSTTGFVRLPPSVTFQF